MPIISVVVVSVAGLPTLERCLRALENQHCEADYEIIAVLSGKRANAAQIRPTFPRVKLIECPERKGIPELRTMGAAQAAGEFIAFTEDRLVADANWLSEIIKAHRCGADVVGGAIEPDGIRGPLDWAVYLCEYCYLMLPVPHGEVGGVGGNNVSYRRELLSSLDESVRKTSWEFFLYEELRRKGIKIFSSPTIIMRKKIEGDLFYALAQRFQFSRSFAGMRRQRISAASRFTHIIAAPLLPPLLLWRISQQVFVKQRFRQEWLSSLPLLALLMLSYVAGELTGYLLGGGESLLEVE